uniref:CusA/CzcA family heavy metal efflux RND transporter n=1 Tax=Roseihalotalea indica TaxID=2867963 RepID=A0AA49JCN5_9BACT|nr:CusA/CzcA family heavy metal efflux RND transporter [Tunicatimonas sp. TK19036]
MLENIIRFSIHHKMIILLFTLSILTFGLYSLNEIPIGAVPDITNNQVQVITTSRNLSTQDVEKFITYPVELEMANLPNVQEIRSISKFGLSVVTIVFDDEIDTYLPRQLIAEKIKSASESIPAGFGSPEMGPVTTGLGEVYQYVLDTKPGYDSMYSPMQLRTIQDWIVRRQLSGIPGVVEINSWGGNLKQYEVAINPEKLRAMNITVLEVFTALERNNSIAGGGYIERSNQSYFVRGEGLVTSQEDIEKIIVKNKNGVPVYVSDVADVHYGHATRFGAITGNGEGEKVLGQVMMLKGANANQVIQDVKARVAEIQKSLPEGVYINPFLERSGLIARTTHTIAENLILGCLIVILVVVVLLGNIRSGLVVASVIPLSLLFAISMMNLFGIDANLMSLGAIDFGIIIDGAVIIVEFIAYQLTIRQNELVDVGRGTRRERIDNITKEGATKMMNSAVFGQLIILIVFIPILALSGVEGKMFKPMAMTFSFALVGAMILCFTYVPVASALFLKPTKKSKRNISQRLMDFLYRHYSPVLEKALEHRAIVLSVAGFFLVITVFIFSRMGGEFIPTLDEGDFVIQPVLPTGTSLAKTTQTTTRMERILLDSFPEVTQVVSRIGAAEVPTDPMSMEESDVIITLKPKSEWVSADSKDELATRFKEALSVIPGIEIEFTQPIEMRFNELITGVRADVAVKVFGEDLDLLAQKGQEIKRVIEDVPGAVDITVEKIVGLPQMMVKYDRAAVARYGLNTADLNQIVSMAFAGVPAGSIYEGEKRFDLVIRLDQQYRQNIDNLRDLYVDLPNGRQIPLRELADITYTKGPAKISRDNTQRRIVVGINVRNRDMESVVNDVQQLISQHIQLPNGYRIEYGGQFENLRSAKQRLQIAVPVALVLIFFMLYFAFGSFQKAAMIYSAIPLAAVGGVLLLWLRDLPFSISAGVGFIALFGIAVLNGIVLIEELEELKEKGMNDIKERILQGTKHRLRPVLLTASAAALGFFPMAISNSAGAEVQRPLATVVIGGLFTATILTMLVLPVLYALFEEKHHFRLRPKKVMQSLLFITLLLSLPSMSNAQDQPATLSLDEAVTVALEKNNALRSYDLASARQEKLMGTALDLGSTSFYWQYDENNIAANGMPIRVWGIEQSLAFPTVYAAQKSVYRSRYLMQQTQYDLKKREVVRGVAQAYDNIVYLQQKQAHFAYLDSLYQMFAHAAARRYELGETNYLEKLTAQARQSQLHTQLLQLSEEINAAYATLNQYVQADSGFRVAEQELKIQEVEEEQWQSHPGYQYFQQQQQMAVAARRTEQQRLLPELQLGYFQGTNQGENAQIYQGYHLGISVPIFFNAQRARIQAAQLEMDQADYEMANFHRQWEGRSEALKAELRKYEQAIQYYRETGEELAGEIMNTAQKSYFNGEIDYFQYIQSLENARELELSYLENLHQYNQTVLEINYLTL